jgi:hypothetical protein
MSKNWLDILKDRLSQRQYEAGPDDWSSMEELLNQHMPVGEGTTSSASSNKGGSWLGGKLSSWILIGVLAVSHAASERFQTPLIEFESLHEVSVDNYNESPIQQSEVSTVEKKAALDEISKEISVKTESNKLIDENEATPQKESSFINELKNSSESKSVASTEIKEERTKSNQTKNRNTKAPIESTSSEKAFASTTNTQSSSKKNISAASATAIAKDKNSIASSTFFETLDQRPEQMIEMDILQRTEPLFTNEELIKKSTASPSLLPSPLDFRQKRHYSMPFNGIRAEYIVLPSGGYGYQLSLEKESGSQLFGIGIGLNNERINFTDMIDVESKEITSQDSWEVDTVYDLRIDSTWVIAGINQGYLRIDSFYIGRLDSQLVTSYDTIRTNTQESIRELISLRSYSIPLRYAWRFPSGRWDHRLGILGSLGMTERVNKVGESSISIDRSFRYAVGLELGTDYYLNSHWALGLSWTPRYRGFGEARLEDDIDWTVIRFQLKWRL